MEPSFHFPSPRPLLTQYVSLASERLAGKPWSHVAPAKAGRREFVVLATVTGSGGSDHAVHLCCYQVGPPGTLWEASIKDEDFAAHVGLDWAAWRRGGGVWGVVEAH